jgi:uncharacterized protein (TIGR02266 family)
LVEHFRRTDPRYDRRFDVELVANGKSVNATCLNLSLGGMFVETDAAVPLQATIQIRFRVPTQPELIDVTGEVRWTEKPSQPGGAAGLGIRFHGLRARDVWALNRFFQT